MCKTSGSLRWESKVRSSTPSKTGGFLSGGSFSLISLSPLVIVTEYGLSLPSTSKTKVQLLPEMSFETTVPDTKPSTSSWIQALVPYLFSINKIIFI